ncbi:SDR family oxidoreductase [Sphingomonas crocodyli]|uniref:SDR family oxidoreductase n=1 Tax=Sphingomonas crocodyli TaxID=1979270 RepID=UPI0013E316A9|nr:NmrA family NAD(P)-binding protein [Sphingomonas crocodyli]
MAKLTAPVLVTGANGKTGRAVLAALAAAGAQARALIRNPAQEGAVIAAGAQEVAVGDLGNADSLSKSAQGCAAIIHIGPPLDRNELIYSRHMIAAARSAGIDRFVYYSVMHTLSRGMRHHALKLEVEQELVESGLAFTILQPIRYMQHLEPIWRRVVDEGVHSMPFGIDRRFNIADLHDLAEATARVVIDPSYAYGIFELAGPAALSQRDMTVILSEELGRPIEAQPVSTEALLSGALKHGSVDRAVQMLVMSDYYDRHGFQGSPAVLRMILGREPTGYRDYVRRLIAAEWA